jgi:hypothetical protein
MENRTSSTFNNVFTQMRKNNLRLDKLDEDISVEGLLFGIGDQTNYKSSKVS